MNQRCVQSTHPTSAINALFTKTCLMWAMAQYIRFSSTGASIFFTVALADRGSTLLCDQIDRLRRAVALTRLEHPFGIDAWVVLPDHMHCIWTMPRDDGDFSTRWRLIKSRFSRGLPMAARRPSHVTRSERAIWQRRFWKHHIQNDADFADHLRYCWHDPVKHGLVTAPTAWPFSSVHRDVLARRYDWAAL